MAGLNMIEQIEVAKMCIQNGIPLETLSDMGININSFPVSTQAEIRATVANSRLDNSIKSHLTKNGDNDLER